MIFQPQPVMSAVTVNDFRYFLKISLEFAHLMWAKESNKQNTKWIYFIDKLKLNLHWFDWPDDCFFGGTDQ